jgi:2-phospho-L-lactate/phosphoenolpyruvate guanylyltransferase
MARRDQPTGPLVAEDAAHSSFAALVPLKRPEMAKSRLASLPTPLRRRLAWTMALDTLHSLASVLPVIVISNQAYLAERLHRQGIRARVIAEPVDAGINPALRHGEDMARAAGFSGTLACVGDLPALRPQSIRRVVAAAAKVPRAFVADVSGEGTTILISHGVELDPRFQGESAAAHRASGAFQLGPAELGGTLLDARRDVDDEADLSEAFQLGLGPATSQLFDKTGQLGRYTVIMTQSGQRLHAVISSGRVLSAWQ